MPGTYPTTGATAWAPSLQAYIDAAPEWANVASATYGADTTGVTDATTQIHAARDAGKGVVYFPPGTYKTAGLTANVAGQRWVIAPGATILGTGAGHAVSVSANGVTIEGTGKIDTGSGSAYSGVFINAGLSDIDVLGLEITNGTYGVRCKGATGAITRRLRVNGCTIHDTAGTSAHGVFFNWETYDSEISQNQIYSTGGNGIWCGNNSSSIRVLHNKINAPGKNGIEFASGGAPDSLIEGNEIDTCNIGISCDTSDRVRVGLNRVTSPTLYGIELANTSYAVVTGNTVRNGSSHGVTMSALTGSVDHNLIVANQIINCAGTSINAGGSANGAKYTQVIGNHIVDPGQNAGGIVAIGATSSIGCDSWTVANNHIFVSATGTLASSNLINVNAPNTAIEGNFIYISSGIPTGGANAIQLSSTCNNTRVINNHIEGNGKLNNGVNNTSTGANMTVRANVINGTTLNAVINNNSATSPLTILVADNVWNVTSGNGGNYGGCAHWGNRSGAATTLNWEVTGTSGTTAPAAGGAGALPATPLGYLTVTINGTNRQIAYY